MRNTLNFLFFLSMFFIFIMSCEKEELSNEDGPIMYRDASSFTYSINPAHVGDSVYISYDALNGADCGHIHIKVSSPDGQGWGGGGIQVEPDNGIATMLFIPDEPGEYKVRAKYTRTGKKSECDEESSGWFEYTELLIVEGDTTNGDTTQMDSCESTFVVDSVTCDSTWRKIVFSFVSDTDQDDVKIKGNLSKGLDDDAVVTVTGGNFDVNQKKPGNSTHRIITLEGSSGACEQITISITWNTSYTGSKLTSAWTAHGDGLNFQIEPVDCE